MLDGLGRHEVLHMSAFIAYVFEREYLDHEQIKTTRRWEALAQTTWRVFNYFCSTIGAERVTEER